jgi:hypothetical protein
MTQNGTYITIRIANTESPVFSLSEHEKGYLTVGLTLTDYKI